MKIPHQKFETIYESYINGNISWVKDEVKKLSKVNRKTLYMWVSGNNGNVHNTETMFFLNLI